MNVSPLQSRRKTRMIALQVLYEASAVAHDRDAIVLRAVEDGILPPEAESFVRGVVEGVQRNREEIDSLIGNLAPEWPIDQMALVDRNILNIAIFEIIYGDETPHKVAINEAVELAKVFGADNSPKFVNGVLGSLMEDIKK